MWEVVCGTSTAVIRWWWWWWWWCQTLTLYSSRLHHALPLSPRGIPVCCSHDPGHWPLSPSSGIHSSLRPPHPLTSQPLLHPPMPSSPSCISFSSPEPPSLFSPYLPVSGSQADAEVAPNLSVPSPNAIWVPDTVVCVVDMRSRRQASGWTGRLTAWLSCSWCAALRPAQCRQQRLYRKEEIYSLGDWIFCLWNLLQVPVDAAAETKPRFTVVPNAIYRPFHQLTLVPQLAMHFLCLKPWSYICPQECLTHGFQLSQNHRGFTTRRWREGRIGVSSVCLIPYNYGEETMIKSELIGV